MASKYRLKEFPTVFEAVQFTLTNTYPNWFKKANSEGTVYYQGGPEPYYTVEESDGYKERANIGDYIVLNDEHFIRVVKKEAFERDYELVE